jgi:hypothetical protein
VTTNGLAAALSDQFVLVVSHGAPQPERVEYRNIFPRGGSIPIHTQLQDVPARSKEGFARR